MRNYLKFAAVIGCLATIVLLAGCASPGTRGRYLEEIEPAGLTNLVAYRGTTNLEIRYALHGKDGYAFASWPGEQGKVFDYQYRYAVLAFEKQPRGTRRLLAKHGTRLAIRDARQWQNLVEGVFQGFLPPESEHGVLVLVQNQEIAIYRDKAGAAHVVKLQDKPANITIDHAYGQEDYTRAAISLLEKSVSRLDSSQTQFLFVTHDDPAFVLIDLKEKLLVFLSYPVDPDSVPGEMPGLFPLQAINSIIVRGFLISAVKNPVTLVGRGLWHIGASGVAALGIAPLGDVAPPPPLSKGPGMDLPQWEKHLDGMLQERRYKGRVEFFIDGDKFYPSMIKAVENAVRSVDVLVFIFGSDQYAVTIANVLKDRSKAVKVRVLMDDMGSLFGGGDMPPASSVPPNFQHPGDIKRYLKENSKIEVRSSANPWLTTDHRKCIIVDGKMAYIGGMNIGWVYRYDWHDMMVRLTGPIVGRLEKDYNEAWEHAGILGDFAYAWECLFGRTHRRQNTVPDEIDIRPLRTATWHTEIYHAQLEAIRRCKSYIYIENAYFTDFSILRELIRARQRGVDVRVILPSKNDSGVMQTGNLIMANEMVVRGIRVYAYPGMTHVKAAIYDGWACLGSANLEKMSLRVSQELDVGFSDPPTVNRLKEGLFEADFKKAREITKPVPLNWTDAFIKAFAGEL
jgi:cardiolipin synthase